jgi:hypothetical protein
MIKTFAQVIYSDLTEEEFAAAETFCTDNGIAYEWSISDATWIRLLNPSKSDLTAIETNVFHLEVQP